MLSQGNRENIIMSGLYRHKPDKRYRDCIHWDDLYHCYNWTFRVRYSEEQDQYFMVDTYWGDKSIELTDEIFSEFDLIFDFNEVEQYSGSNIWEYDEADRWCVAVDSGGIQHPKSFVRKGAVKNKELVLRRIQEEIDSLEWRLQRKKQDYERVMNDEVNLNYI